MVLVGGTCDYGADRGRFWWPKSCRLSLVSAAFATEAWEDKPVTPDSKYVINYSGTNAR